MRDLLLILGVLLVLLILISIFGGSIRFPVDHFETGAGAGAQQQHSSPRGTSAAVTVPKVDNRKPVQLPQSSTAAATIEAAKARMQAAQAGETVEAFQGEEYALVPEPSAGM